MKKICLRCGKEKPLSQFYKHKAMRDGYLNICKKCVKKIVTNYRKENIEKIRAYDRFRSQPKNISIARKRSRQINNKRWRLQDKRRSRAHNLVEKKLRKNKPETCQICGRKTKLHGHHEDYNKPSEVIWCCPICHFKLHRIVKNITPNLPFQG